MEASRRNLLKTGAVLPVALGVGGMAQGALFTCGANGIQIDPAVLDEISKAVATGCNFIPAITTVIAVVNQFFPALVGQTTIAESVLAQISAKLCATNPAAHKLGGPELKIEGSDIPVHGWVVQDGKLVYV